MSDDECIHLNNPAYCTICNGKDAATKPVKRAALPVKRIAPRGTKTTSAPSKSVTTSTAVPVIDTPEAVEALRVKYPEDRQDTFDAYVDVFFNTDARGFTGGWANFAKCASADPERKDNSPALVVAAEGFMKSAGYEHDDSGRPMKTRRWFKEED